jgi:hypothetical protein
MSEKMSSNYIKSAKQKAEQQTMQIFDEYKELLLDKTHPDNQSPAYKERVSDVVKRMIIYANDLDGESPGNGIFGLIALMLRANLKLKDQVVELEARVRKLDSPTISKQPIIRKQEQPRKTNAK